jgi:Ran GTPase-activating protein (RanGAP) involved in mRNA processing and transport
MCGITADGCKSLSEALARNQSLMSLDFSSNRFGSRGAINLFAADRSFGRLSSLILSRNAIGDAATQQICRQLEFASNLRFLDLGDNELGITFLKRLHGALQVGTGLETLNLRKNRFGPESAELLHFLIRDFPSLHHLNLSGNVLKDPALSHIADALNHTEALLTLDLSECGMGDSSASIFAGIIGEKCSLQRFYVATNHITDVGGVLLGKALATNKNVVVLSLRNNELRDETAAAILESLAVNTTVADLDISYNDFSYRAYVKLSQTIEEHKRTLNSNVAEIAGRHIEWLKEEERRLFDFRDQIREQEGAVAAITSERNLKQQGLANLKQAKQEETDRIQGELDEIRAKYDEISEERRSQQQDFNEVKMAAELKQGAALATYQNLAAKRQQLQTRLSRTETKKKEQFSENEKMLAGLRQELHDAREQLHAAIADTVAAKKMLLDEEEREKEEQRLAEEAAKPPEETSSKKKKGRKASPKKEKKEKKKKAAEAPTPKPAPLASDIVGQPGEKPGGVPKARPKTSLAKAKPK